MKIPEILKDRILADSTVWDPLEEYEFNYLCIWKIDHIYFADAFSLQNKTYHVGQGASYDEALFDLAEQIKEKEEEK